MAAKRIAKGKDLLKAFTGTVTEDKLKPYEWGQHSHLDRYGTIETPKMEIRTMPDGSQEIFVTIKASEIS